MGIEILQKGNHCCNSYASKKRRRLIKHSSCVLCGHILTNLTSFSKVHKNIVSIQSVLKHTWVWSRLVLRFNPLQKYFGVNTFISYISFINEAARD